MNGEVVKRYFALIEQFGLSENDFEPLLHPEVEQTEYPNLLTDRVVVSNRETLFQRMAHGSKLLEKQKYDIERMIEYADTVIAEVTWTATVRSDAGPFKAGQQLKAYFCCVFEFKDGRIYRQRNYDCFEHWNKTTV